MTHLAALRGVESPLRTSSPENHLQLKMVDMFKKDKPFNVSGLVGNERMKTGDDFLRFLTLHPKALMLWSCVNFPFIRMGCLSSFLGGKLLVRNISKLGLRV